MEAACTACCTARLYNLVWTVPSQDFGLKLNQHLGIGLGNSILFQNGTLTRPVDKVLYWTAVARLFRGVDLQVGVMEGGWIWS
jgi:hypothetical protein